MPPATPSSIVSTNPISALLTIINSSTTELQSLHAQNGSQIPSLDAYYKPSLLEGDPRVVELTKLVVAAANQLIATVRAPRDTFWEYVPGMYLSAALGFVVEVDVAEILNEAPNKSLHAKDIAFAANCDASHIARVLRYLATRHIFREVTPDVFANNKLSSALIKTNGKTVKELKAKPLEKYENSGNAAFVGHLVGEGLKSSSAMIDFLKNSRKGANSPFNMAWGTNKSLWDWYAEPKEEWRFGRFVAAMQFVAETYKDSIFQNAYNWASLKSTDVIVDVGGNMGSVSLAIAKMFPETRFVIQDLPPVIEEAKPFWKAHFPEAIANGRVKLEAHDFFLTQPIKGAAIYFCRFIIQDWPDADCIKIMKRLREAASPTSKLILFEIGIPYACADPTRYDADVERRSAPYPLIPNLGKGGGSNPTNVDMTMLNLLNGQGRSIGQFVELGNATGWKLASAKNDELSIFTFSAAA
ncbi:S-adenosyl-L-methionine-dependent methyltransferase [Collybia nuda]|uniref:S-adenosyl-L-methionine-dependent methyltransferase n=1 Tax=Collybia nuda TaxID=64659 RepID=A0A9P5Y9A6_9AGAR|nr:S-adenosyl-L-methionine-dependent methyltransferase [Collybia nuda]